MLVKLLTGFIARFLISFFRHSNPENKEEISEKQDVISDPPPCEGLDMDSECVACNTIIPKGEKSALLGSVYLRVVKSDWLPFP